MDLFDWTYDPTIVPNEPYFQESILAGQNVLLKAGGVGGLDHELLAKDGWKHNTSCLVLEDITMHSGKITWGDGPGDTKTMRHVTLRDIKSIIIDTPLEP